MRGGYRISRTHLADGHEGDEASRGTACETRTGCHVGDGEDATPAREESRRSRSPVRRAGHTLRPWLTRSFLTADARLASRGTISSRHPLPTPPPYPQKSIYVLADDSDTLRCGLLCVQAKQRDLAHDHPDAPCDAVTRDASARVVVRQRDAMTDATAHIYVYILRTLCRYCST